MKSEALVPMMFSSPEATFTNVAFQFFVKSLTEILSGHRRHCYEIRNKIVLFLSLPLRAYTLTKPHSVVSPHANKKKLETNSVFAQFSFDVVEKFHRYF